MKDIFLSIIVPTYNNDKYIYDSLLPALKQCDESVEIIIINDGSTDHTDDEIKRALNTEHRAHIKYLNQKTNMGIAQTRNIGLEQASGEYISFLDGDDLWFDNFIEVVYPILKNDKPDLIDFDYIKFRTEDTSLPVKACIDELQKCIHKNDPAVLHGCFKRSHWHVWSRIFKKDILGDHKFPSKGRYEDMYFTPWLYFKAKSIVSIKLPLYLYRHNQHGITQNIIFDDIKNMTDSLEYTINEFNVYDNNKEKQQLLKLVILNCFVEIKSIHKKIHGFYNYDPRTCDLIKKASNFITDMDMKPRLRFHARHPELMKTTSKVFHTFKK